MRLDFTILSQVIFSVRWMNGLYVVNDFNIGRCLTLQLNDKFDIDEFIYLIRWIMYTVYARG